MISTHYVVDLNAPKLTVQSYSPEVIEADLKLFDLADPLDLSDPDLKVFKTERQATAWLAKYKRTKKSLNNSKMCKSRELPTLLYKRKYLIQSLLGEKLYTVRKYKKAWNAGDLINLYDQTYFLTVRILSIEADGVGYYKYSFELP